MHTPASPRLRPASLQRVDVLVYTGLRFVGPASPRLRPASLGRAIADYNLHAEVVRPVVSAGSMISRQRAF